MTHFADHVALEQALTEFCRHIREDFPGTINEGLAPRLSACDLDPLRCTIAFDGKPWMSNPLGAVHGGVVSAMLDTAMGGITYVCAEDYPTPTISLQVSYIRPVPATTTLYVDVQTNGMGQTMGNLTARLYSPDRPDRVLATASGVYYVKI